MLKNKQELIREMFANAEVDRRNGHTEFIIRNLTAECAAVLRGAQVSQGLYENIYLNTGFGSHSAVVIDNDVANASMATYLFAGECKKR